MLFVVTISVDAGISYYIVVVTSLIQTLIKGTRKSGKTEFLNKRFEFTTYYIDRHKLGKIFHSVSWESKW